MTHFLSRRRAPEPHAVKSAGADTEKKGAAVGMAAKKSRGRTVRFRSRVGVQEFRSFRSSEFRSLGGKEFQSFRVQSSKEFRSSGFRGLLKGD